MPTFQSMQAGYQNLWAKCQVRPEKVVMAEALAHRAQANFRRYAAVSAEVPPEVVACLHYRESNFDFNTYLGNGQPLDKVTTEVPAGRGPFATWEAGAADALQDIITWYIESGRPTWTVARCLYVMERFNGWGYLNKINSPYIWSWTTLYTSGKYVADHVEDPSAVDAQCGCAAILKSLVATGAITFEETKMPDTPTPAPIPTVVVTHPTTGQQFTLPVIDFAAMENALKTIGSFIPIMAAFPVVGPYAAAAVQFLPIVEGGLEIANQIETAVNSGQPIGPVFASGLKKIATQVEALFPPKPAS